jgi:hypothetical protein
LSTSGSGPPDLRAGILPVFPLPFFISGGHRHLASSSIVLRKGLLDLRELPALIGELAGEGEVAAVARLVGGEPPAGVRQPLVEALPLAF